MIKPNTKTNLKALDRCRELAKQLPSPLKGRTKAQILKELRQSREDLWQEKYGPAKTPSRHQ